MSDDFNSSSTLPPENDDLARDIILDGRLADEYRAEHPGGEANLDRQNADDTKFYKPEPPDYSR